MSTITERVTKVIMEKLTVEESEIKMESNFLNELGADSIDLVELIMEFENEFSVSIPDEAAEEIKTVGDAVKYLEQHAQ